MKTALSAPRVRHVISQYCIEWYASELYNQKSHSSKLQQHLRAYMTQKMFVSWSSSVWIYSSICELVGAGDRANQSHAHNLLYLCYY